MHKIIEKLPVDVSRKFLNEWLEINVDKKDLEENFFDGHGFYKDEENSLTVYVVKKTPLVFFYNPKQDSYKWKILGDDEWTKWKDTTPNPFKMKARF